jgi:hypothetical protein
MGVQELRIQIAMTTDASGWIKASDGFFVAIGAFEGGAIPQLLVSLKRETDFVMRKISQGLDRQRCIRSSMVGVAVMAADILTFGHHHVVKVFGILDKVGMAGQTAISHLLFFPGSSMAC